MFKKSIKGFSQDKERERARVSVRNFSSSFLLSSSSIHFSSSSSLLSLTHTLSVDLHHIEHGCVPCILNILAAQSELSLSIASSSCSSQPSTMPSTTLLALRHRVLQGGRSPPSSMPQRTPVLSAAPVVPCAPWPDATLAALTARPRRFGLVVRSRPLGMPSFQYKHNARRRMFCEE